MTSKTIETLEERLTEIMQHLTFAVDRNTIREAISQLAAPEAPRKSEPLAWMRKWAADGVTPEKVLNENGRWAWPFKFKLVPVSQQKCLPDDVALYADQADPLSPDHSGGGAGVVLPDLAELREHHATAVSNLKLYADDAGLRDSDIKHYTKRAEFHARMVEVIDKVKELNQ